MGIEANLWRQETPGDAGWTYSAKPGAKNKYLMISCDAHVNESQAWIDRMTPDLREMLPRVEIDEHGQRWDIIPGMRRVRSVMHEFEGDDEDKERMKSARNPEQIIENMDRDGVDIQISFPNKGLFAFALGDPRGGNTDKVYPFARTYNEWLADEFRHIKDRLLPMALLPTADIDLALEELKRIRKADFFRGLMVPNKPVFGPYSPMDLMYNNPAFDRLWAEIQDTGLAMTFHVGTGYDSRAVKGPGASITAYTAHSHPTTIEPVAHLCASGVLERFPGLRFATVESGIGQIAWMIEAMDEAYKKHHLWVRQKLKNLPSEYYYQSGFATFQEDPAGLAIIDPRLTNSKYRRLENCFLWANDYPHHEGSWPHSAQAIERQMGDLTEDQRIKLLGENAIRCFGIADLAEKRRPFVASMNRSR